MFSLNRHDAFSDMHVNEMSAVSCRRRPFPFPSVWARQSSIQITVKNLHRSLSLLSLLPAYSTTWLTPTRNTCNGIRSTGYHRNVIMKFHGCWHMCSYILKVEKDLRRGWCKSDVWFYWWLKNAPMQYIPSHIQTFHMLNGLMKDQ